VANGGAWLLLSIANCRRKLTQLAISVVVLGLLMAVILWYSWRSEYQPSWRRGIIGELFVQLVRKIPSLICQKIL
jgi:ABC-type arginine transport system permease subunit